MKIVIAPDSFKGSISSINFCQIAKLAIKKICPEYEVIELPMADGGEGTSDAVIFSLGGHKEFVNVSGPDQKLIKANYAILPDKKTAVIDISSAAGLTLEKHPNPLYTTTLGVGMLISNALDKGITKIILGLGGSGTNDLGTGMLSHLGVKFFNSSGENFIPTGITLNQINDIDTSHIDSRIIKTDFVAMCDVSNPLLGSKGSALTFSSQKGATSKEVDLLEKNGTYLSELIYSKFGFKNNFPGDGAAGGLGYASRCFLNAKVEKGIEFLLDITNFDHIISNADYIITGEGKIDKQTLDGKTILGIVKRAKKQNKRTIAVVGDIADGYQKLYSKGLTAVFSINRKARPFEEAIKYSSNDLYYTIMDIFRIIKGIG
jgi:glycerate kinase